MPFQGNPLTIRRIWVIPWDLDRGLYGIAYEYADGGCACEVVGSQVEAQAVVDEVERHAWRAGPAMSSAFGNLTDDMRALR